MLRIFPATWVRKKMQEGSSKKVTFLKYVRPKLITSITTLGQHQDAKLQTLLVTDAFFITPPLLANNHLQASLAFYDSIYLDTLNHYMQYSILHKPYEITVLRRSLQCLRH